MKPQLTPSRARWLSRYDEPSADHRPAPLLEWGFQARRFGSFFGGGDSPQRRPGFNALAKEVLRADSSRSFRLESAVLGLVALVSAWPIAIMIHEVIRLLILIYA
jgi:hypothetical protein